MYLENQVIGVNLVKHKEAPKNSANRNTTSTVAPLYKYRKCMYSFRSIISVATDKTITSRDITVYASELHILDKNKEYDPKYDYENMKLCHFCGATAAVQALIQLWEKM